VQGRQAWTNLLAAKAALDRGEDATAFVDAAEQGAREMLEAAKSSPEGPKFAALALVLRAGLEIRAGRDPSSAFHEAQRLIERALEIDDYGSVIKNWVALTYLAEAEWRASKGERPVALLGKAKHFLAQALATDALSVRAMLLSARVAMVAGDHPRARAWVEKARKLDPASVNVKRQEAKL